MFKGAYFYRDGRGKRGEEKGREDEAGREERGQAPNYFGLEPPLLTGAPIVQHIIQYETP